MRFQQLDIFQDSKNICKQVAVMVLPPEEITNWFGITFVEVDRDNGLGPSRGAVILTEHGRRCNTDTGKKAPRSGLTNIRRTWPAT